MKKGQLIGQIFIYILAIILIAFVLGYGYKTIAGFRQKTEQASYIKFRNELQNAIKAISTDFGSVKIVQLDMPSNYKEVCFVRNHENFPVSFSAAGYPIIEDSVNSGIEKNVFLVQETVKESFYVGKITLIILGIDKDFYCAPVLNGKVKLRLEGKGNHALISEAS